MIKYKNYEHKIAENEQTVRHLQDQIHRGKSDADRWQDKCKTTEGRVKELENHLFLNTQEKEKLGNLIKSKNNEYD